MNLGDFYKHDRRLGSTMQFDGVDVYAKYNADVHSFVPTAGSVDNTMQRKVSKSSFDLFHFDFAACTLVVDAYVGGANKLDMLMNVNGYIAAARKCVIYYAEDLGFEFDANLASYSVTDTGVEWFTDVSLTFNAIRRMPLVSGNNSKLTTFEFENLGSVPSGLRLKITPTGSFGSSQLWINRGTDDEQHITISSLTQSYMFLIDGIDGLVQERGINSILKTDLITFPKVQPGMNKVTINFAASVEYEFYPTFEI